MGEAIKLHKDQVFALNEKHGWFTYGDAQSDVSRAFASDAIAEYERVRNEATAVCVETGLTPSQLVERVKELEEALDHMAKSMTRQLALIADRAPGPYLDKRPVVQTLHMHAQRAQKALSKARPNTAEGEAHGQAPAAGAVAGPTVTREFTNELGNAIRITVEGPSSMHENIVTPMEAEQFRSALNEHAMRAADTTWCAYVAGMICTYLNEDADGQKAKAISGIIERRLMFLSKSTAPMDRDTLYLLRRLLSNQFTFTSAEFRAELEKIVEGAASKQEAPAAAKEPSP